MKILITGVCGFAGSVIARGLRETLPGTSIFGIDNFTRRGSETNLEPLRQLGIDIRAGDIRFPADLATLGAADWVIDCAANPSVLAGVDGVTGPRDLLDHNLVGTINLLEYCRGHAAGFILLSTSRVYSIFPLAALPVAVRDEALVPDIGPQIPGISAAGISEEFSTEPPLSLYGSSKRCSELLALEYGLTFGFPVRINRCGVLAGAGQFGKADQGIFSYWIHSWAGRRPLKYIGFNGTGHQVRDCLHPRDIVPLLVRQMADPARPVSPVQNLAGGVENAMSLAQLSRWCAEHLGPHSVQPQFEPRPFDIPWMVLDSARAARDWDWRPATPLRAILQEISEHAASHPGWLAMTSPP
jgi:CDP-paratose 2-epimerase